MIQRPLKNPRFKTPPEITKLTDQDITSAQVKEIRTDQKSFTETILSENLQTLIYLIKNTREIKAVRWIHFTNNLIFLVPYSQSPHTKGFGSFYLNQEEFDLLQKLFEDSEIQFIFGSTI